MNVLLDLINTVLDLTKIVLESNALLRGPCGPIKFLLGFSNMLLNQAACLLDLIFVY